MENLINELEKQEIARFGWDKNNHATVIEILDDDKFNMFLSDEEIIVRYYTRKSLIGNYMPLVKINKEKEIVYFIVDGKFETRGTKLNYLKFL